MINLISKIFHWSLVVNLVVKFQTKLGDLGLCRANKNSARAKMGQFFSAHDGPG